MVFLVRKYSSYYGSCFFVVRKIRIFFIWAFQSFSQDLVRSQIGISCMCVKATYHQVKFFRFIIVLFLFLTALFMDLHRELYLSIISLLWKIFRISFQKSEKLFNYYNISHTRLANCDITHAPTLCCWPLQAFPTHWHFAASLNVSNMHPVESTRTASLDNSTGQ